MHWQMGVEGTVLSLSLARDGTEPQEVCNGLGNSVVKATLGAGSHPLPWLAGEAGSEWSIPGESYLPVSAPALGPFWDQAPLGTVFTTAFTGPC